MNIEKEHVMLRLLREFAEFDERENGINDRYFCKGMEQGKMWANTATYEEIEVVATYLPSSITEEHIKGFCRVIDPMKFWRTDIYKKYLSPIMEKDENLDQTLSGEFFFPPTEAFLYGFFQSVYEFYSDHEEFGNRYPISELPLRRYLKKTGKPSFEFNYLFYCNEYGRGSCRKLREQTDL